VQFIGPLLPKTTGELPALDGRPIVLITQGTLATDPSQLIAPAKAALAGDDVQVITTETFVPFAQLMPKVACFVTNGGYGGVQQALAHGVPMVVAGGSEEKPEIAARVAWCGAGIDLRTGTPSERKLRKAVRRVLAEPAFRERAQRMAAEMAKCDAVASAVAAIEATLARDVPISPGAARGL
jgi:UDP:flavonoid glycosyltransferase YjiC (YdhE family)